MFSFLCLGGYFVLGCAQTGDLAVHNAPTRLHVGTSGDYTPFSDWPESTVEPRGFSVDVTHAFARERGFEITWVRYSWPSLVANLNANAFDFAISGITVRTERSTAGRFSIPLTTSGAVVLVPRDTSFESAEDLDRPGVRLAVNAGGHLERVARERFRRAAILSVPRNEEVLGRLLDARDGNHGENGSERVNGVVTDTVEASHWQAQWRTRTGETLRRIGPFTEDRKAAFFRPERTTLAHAFDAWLLEAEKDGRLGKLRERHGLATDSTASPISALLASIDERLSLMNSVANVKAVLGLAIEDRARERRVVDAAWRSVQDAAQRSAKRPPPREAVEALFRAQIGAAKWIQRKALAQRDTDPLTGPRAEVASAPERQLFADDDVQTAAQRELQESLRPALIRIGDRIAMLIAELGQAEDNPPTFADTAQALARHGLPEHQLRALDSALVNLLPRATRVEP